MDIDNVNPGDLALVQDNECHAAGRGSMVTSGSDLTNDRGLITLGTTTRKRRSGSAKNSAGNARGSDKTERHRLHWTHLSKQ